MKRFLSLILTVCILFSLLATVLSVSAAAVSHVQDKSYDGLEISSHVAKSKAYGAEYYEATKRLEEVPRSFESWIYLTASMRNATVGTIIGNYGKAGGSFSLGITKKFFPEMRFYNGSAGKDNPTHKAVFDEVELDSGSWIHLVITVDEVLGELKCYVNGELKQTISAKDTCTTTGCKEGCAGIFRLDWAAKYPIHLGGTDEPLNPMYFRGYLQDTALYSDVLTADEVKGSYENGVNAFDENLICYYDIDSSDKGKNIADSSGNGYDLYYSRLLLTEEQMQELREENGFGSEYDYSIAVIGDIQYMTRTSPKSLNKLYQWIADNKDAKNIQYAIGLGDITDQCQEAEWLLAADVYKILEDAGLEYSLVRGNHDVATVGGITEESRKTAVPEMYDELFYNNDFYRSQFEKNGGFYEEGSVINTYRTLTIGDDNWLIVNLDFQPDEKIKAWANSIISKPEYSEHRVVVVTHEYVGAHGTPSTYGRTLWADVISKHANIELVLSGHVTYDNINVYQCKGDNGNTVTQMLIDAQNFDLYMGGLGVVTMFYFREDGTVIDIEHYSTVKDRYLMNINQRTVDLRADCDFPVFIWDGVTSEAPLGDGTYENPYKISKAANLLWMAEQHYVTDEDVVIAPTSMVNPFKDKYFVQTADINLYGKTLPSIGYYFESEDIASVFGGNYDGRGYSIRNGNIANPLLNGASVGLFAETYGASVSGVSLRNITVNAAENTAFLIGRANSADLIKDCRIYDNCTFRFDNVTDAEINVGAILGSAAASTIISCENEAAVIAGEIDAIAGGIVGAASSGTVIYNSLNDGAVSAGGLAGGLVGEISGTVTVAGCKNKAKADDYNLSEGAHVHTADAFVKDEDGTHTASCECEEKIVLPCVVSEHGYCKYCQLYITGASLTVGSDVAINYYVKINDASVIADKTLAMEFVMNGKSITVDQYSVKNGKLVFKLGGILPEEIGDSIDANLIISDGEKSSVIASKLGYSVRDNCMALLSQLKDEKAREVIVSLLEYASKAQAYLDYNTDKFVLGGVSIPASDKAPSEADKELLSGNKNTDCYIIDSYAALDNSLKLKIEISVKELSELVITVNKREYDKTQLTALGDSKYLIEIDNFHAAKIGDIFEISLIYKNKQAAMVTLSVNSHLYSLIEDKKQIEEDKANHVPVTKSVDEAEYALFLAVYRYNVAAEEYYNLLTEASK